MKYQTFKIIMRNKQRVFLYDCSDGTGTDSTVDTNVTKDPNDYLAQRIDKLSIIEYLLIIALVIGIIYMYMQVLRQAKTI